MIRAQRYVFLSDWRRSMENQAGTIIDNPLLQYKLHAKYPPAKAYFALYAGGYACVTVRFKQYINHDDPEATEWITEDWYYQFDEENVLTQLRETCLSLCEAVGVEIV